MSNSVVLVASGPTACAEDVQKFEAQGYDIAAVSTAYILCNNPVFIAASDAAWWRVYKDVPDCRCYSMAPSYLAHLDRMVAVIRIAGLGIVNSGVLALEMAKRHGYKTIYLYGFDMYGSHFSESTQTGYATQQHASATYI